MTVRISPSDLSSVQAAKEVDDLIKGAVSCAIGCFEFGVRLAVLSVGGERGLGERTA
jgi:hypothetical protein